MQEVAKASTVLNGVTLMTPPDFPLPAISWYVL